MDDAPRRYELWDFDTRNCTGVYTTLDAALDIVTSGVAGMSRKEAEAWVEDLVLMVYDARHGDDAREVYAEGPSLLDAALEREAMTNAPRGYELWDLDAVVLLADYDTVSEALAGVRGWAAAETAKEAWVEAFALIEITADGSFGKTIAEGHALISLAWETT